VSQSDRFVVHLPAGPLTVEMSSDWAVMAGPVAHCCRGFVDCDN
jgi:diaminopimelate epimerase